MIQFSNIILILTFFQLLKFIHSNSNSNETEAEEEEFEVSNKCIGTHIRLMDKGCGHIFGAPLLITGLSDSDMEAGIREILFDIQTVENGIIIANNSFSRFDSMKTLYEIRKSDPGPALIFHKNVNLEYVEFRNLQTIRAGSLPKIRFVDDNFPISARYNIEASKSFNKIITAATLVPAAICDTDAFELIVTSSSHQTLFGNCLKVLMTFLGMFVFIYMSDVIFYGTFLARKSRYIKARNKKRREALKKLEELKKSELIRQEPSVAPTQ